ncbi:hypothetical protein DOM22_10985 [Bdellovibrio sp. ZAP7]|uniref:hypothetical protein n=1 Tax=Bdellovibrio sp. ZAP7 TaxID=2231053 RepID=UPI0011577A7A|nr:hypothetical protein [Bdellovibrio sp. ZAP7]QDK45636.1 hypothetical protein DOM22_10985 [Bdellovibrio sp. ZAP7]
MNFLIDNSALNEILKIRPLTENVTTNIIRTGSRLFISYEAYLENASGTKRENVKLRAGNLHWMLSNSRPNQIVITKPVIKWLEKELKNNGRFNYLPTLYTEQRWPNFLKFLSQDENFSDIYDSSEEGREWLKQSKDHFKERDKVFREAGKVLSQDELRQSIVNINLQTPAYQLTTFRRIFGISNNLIKNIIFTPNRKLYRIHRTYFMLIYLRMLGNAYSEYKHQDEIGFLREIIRGNWYDLAIIAQASQFNYLISNDADQRAMTNFLFDKGLVKCKAISLQEFVEKISKI